MPGNFGQVNYDPNAFLKGATAAQAFNQVLAQNKAASVYKPEDTTASQAALNGAGLYDQANKLADRPNEVRADQLKVDQAQQTLDNGAQDQQNQNQEAEWKKVGEVTSYLQNIKRNGGDVAQTYQGMKNYLMSSLGLDEQHFNAIGDQLVNNPGFLDAIHENANKIVGGSVVNTDNGNVVYDGTKAQKPQIVNDAAGRPWRVVTDDAGNVQLEALPIAPDGQSQTGVPAPGGMTIEDFTKGLPQGAVVSSGLRSPADNARVGGVPNSKHLTGQAADVVKPAGMTWASFNQSLQAQGYKTIPERGNRPVSNIEDADHIHVEFNGGSGAPAAGQPSVNGFALKQPKAAAGTGGEPDPEAVKYLAEQYNAYGPSVLSGLGNGKAASALKLAVISQATNTYDNLDAGAAGANYRANSNSLSKVQSQYDVTKGFEEATSSAATLVGDFDKKYAPALHPTGIPTLDGPLVSMQIAAGQNPEAKAFRTFVNTVTEEYAKVMSGSLGTAAATDSAREAAKRMEAADTSAQIKQVIQAMRTEMAARTGALKGNVEDVSGRIGTQRGGKKAWSDDELDAILKGN